MRIALFAGILLLSLSAQSQNVFDPADALTRWDSTLPLGSPANPNPAITGLQKWVSVPTNSISAGSGAWDASSYKAYYINVNGVRLAFRLKFPYSYSNPDSVNKKYPVMLFFHGAGEPGCATNGGIYNNEKQLLHGGELFRDRVDNNLFDGFLFYPQVVVEDCASYWPTQNDVAVLAILDSLIKYAKADIDRLFVDGLSDGGRTAWRFARAHPQRVSSIAPSSMSARVSQAALSVIVHIPVWFATGGRDSNPSPEEAQETLNFFTDLGGDIRYTLYPELGHSVWYQHWGEPDFVPFMNQTHKANPLVFFLHDEWCSPGTIAARLGLTPGFYSYEWRQGEASIARSTNGSNTVLDPSAVTSFAGNEIVVKEYGTYSARFKRTATSEWSEWSPRPIVISVKEITQPGPIRVLGIHSKVLPALDGSTTVPIFLDSGFLSYRWYTSSSMTVIGNEQVFEAGIGSYRGQYDENFGCGSLFSPDFVVIDANGSPKPSPAADVVGLPLSQTAIKLTWTDNPSPVNNETNFEIYRGTSPGGPYQLIHITPADIASFEDDDLQPGTDYYYLIRAVNNTGAAAASNEAGCKTMVDNSRPSAPTDLVYDGSSLTSVSLDWDRSSDNIGIKRYDIYVNDVKTYSTTSSSFTVNNLDSLKWYRFTLRAVDESGNASAPSPQVMGYTHHPGLTYKYYNGSFDELPDFNTLTPVSTGIATSVNSGSSFRTQDDNYAVLWEGYIYIPVTGVYTFATISDEGSKVWIDVPYSADAVPVVDADGIHTPSLIYGVIPLSKGYHRIAVAYFEKTGSESMDLYWANDQGISGEEIGGGFFTYTEVAGIPPLTPPSGLTATTAGYNKIKLDWQDNSSNETAFEILRSLAPGGPYEAAGRIGPNKLTFTDSALASATTYYYKVRVIGLNSESPYTAEAFATTLPAPGTPVAPTAFAAENSTTTFISLGWIDNSNIETNYQVWRSSDDGNTFELLSAIPASSNSYTDATVSPYAKYYYYVVGVNMAGNGASSDTIEVIAGNDAPVIGDINNMFIKTDVSASQDFTVTDPGDNLHITITNKPSFIALQHLTGNNYRITLTPNTDHIGWYILALNAIDSKNAITTKTFTVSVADKNTRSVYVNFGSAGKTAPAPWNNWLGTRGANNIISNLKDENNQVTPFSVTTVNGWSATNDLGHLTGNNSGVAPDSVLQSGIANNGTPRQIRIAGLNSSKRYNIVFIGSRNEGLNAETSYATGTQSATANARYNTNTTANLNSLVPNTSGEITITASRINGSSFSYLNGLVIEEYEPEIMLLQPLNLHAETVDKTTVNLSWSDRTNNESAENGYEITVAKDSLFTTSKTTVNLPANTTTYQVTGLQANTRYWFAVRAASVGTFSEYSNRVSSITPASLVYVNFNLDIPSEPAPWNNTVAQPTSPTTFSNLRNDAGLNSGLRLRIEQIFNGEFTAGMNTGNNSGVAPDLVLQSAYWLDKMQISSMRLSGMNQTRKYRIGFVGSSGPVGWFSGNYTATYTVNGKTVYLNSWNNTSKIVYIDNIRPDENGEALLLFSTTEAAQWAFNSGVIIENYFDGKIPGELILPIEEKTDSLRSRNRDKFNRIYPNPFHDAVTIDFNNAERVYKLTAAVYDISGKLVHAQVFEDIVPGMNRLKLNTERLNPANKIFTVVLYGDGKMLLMEKLIRH